MRKLPKGGSTNARLWELVWTRKLGDHGEGTLEETEKVPRPKKTNQWNRKDLVVSLKAVLITSNRKTLSV